ncbi:hypothetical protein [Paenibacillus sp. UNC499MF]|uniref:hypothetical protein n=1 Tax=Paenibacillus sp. UNC499MF TaxID=1502751 RepID=UPI00089FAE7B|nr:hypothetical protein [Paenibacillus sp. UNC499MF]SEF95100.1 hypothetical protein SAMN02799616_01554 [Paenibacillus sp. UNC499MF]
MFQTISPYSPVSQSLIWLAEYENGEIFSEYELDTKAEHSFMDINREKLLRFGQIGSGHKFYYEVSGGIFKIDDKIIELVYKHGDTEYALTGQQQSYRDVIAYKNMEFTFNPNGEAGNGTDQIIQYNFGYKAELHIESVQFHFQILYKIPTDGRSPYFYIKLVSDKTLDGELVIKRDGVVADTVNAPLTKNKGGEINWFLP